MGHVVIPSLHCFVSKEVDVLKAILLHILTAVTFVPAVGEHVNTDLTTYDRRKSLDPSLHCFGSKEADVLKVILLQVVYFK